MAEGMEEKNQETGVEGRRDFLLRAAGALAGAGAAVCLAGATRVATAPFFSGRQPAELLGQVGQFRFGTLTWIREKEIFVLRDEKGLGAFSSRCTHLGCSVRRTAEGFVCPCHGARYDDAGVPVAGPARRPLDWYRLWVAPDGGVWIDWSQTVAVGTRTAPTGEEAGEP